MHKAKRIFKRVFFCFMSVVLVCCMLFNMATPKAQAIAIADDIAIGIVALLLLATAGVVVHVNNQNQIGAVGNSFKTSMYQWGTSAEKLDEVDEFFGGLTLYNPGGSDDGNDDPRREVRLARGILTGIATWIVSTVMAGGVVEEGDTAPDGYLYYNGLLYPDYHSINKTFTEDHVFLIFVNGQNTYFRVFDTSKGSFSWDQLGGAKLYFTGSSNCITTYTLSQNGYWGSAGNSTSVYTGYDSILWSSFDILSGGSVLMPGTIPSQKSNEIILSSTHVGDLPDEIRSGEKDEDDIILPDIINYGAIMQDGMTLEESVIDTLGQLSSGALDYNQFVHDTVSAESPVFTQNLPLTPTMSFEYAVGEKADTFAVEATGNGSLLYEWLDTSTTPYTVLGTGQSFTPDTSRATSYPLVCRVTNTIPCSFVSTGYVTNSSYSHTYYISVAGEAVDPPGSDTETDEDEKLGIISGTLDRIESLLNPDTDTLTDSSQALQGSMNALGTFEQSQLDALQNNKHVITDAFKIFGEGSTLLSAFNLVTYIVNGTYNSLGLYQVVIILPVVLGTFLFICSRVRGFDKPRKNNPGIRSSQDRASAAAGVNDPKSPEV